MESVQSNDTVLRVPEETSRDAKRPRLEDISLSFCEHLRDVTNRLEEENKKLREQNNTLLDSLKEFVIIFLYSRDRNPSLTMATFKSQLKRASIKVCQTKDCSGAGSRLCSSPGCWITGCTEHMSRTMPCTVCRQPMKVIVCDSHYNGPAFLYCTKECQTATCSVCKTSTPFLFRCMAPECKKYLHLNGKCVPPNIVQCHTHPSQARYTCEEHKLNVPPCTLCQHV